MHQLCDWFWFTGPMDNGLSERLERWLADRRGGSVRLRVPRRGPKRKLLELVEQNARLAFETRLLAKSGGKQDYEWHE